MTGVHHVTLAVDDVRKPPLVSWQRDTRCGVRRPQFQYDGGVRRRIALDNAYVDLESPSGPGALAEFLRTHGEGPFELGLETPDIEAAVAVDSARWGRAAAKIVEGKGGPSSLIDPSSAAGVRLRLVADIARGCS